VDESSTPPISQRFPQGRARRDWRLFKHASRHLLFYEKGHNPMPRAVKVSKRRRAKALNVLAAVVDDESAPTHARVTAARTLVLDDPDEAELVVEDRPNVEVVLPAKNRLPGQREDETVFEFYARRRAWVEGLRAAYCASIGEPYDRMKALPFWPWPGDDASPELRAEANRMHRATLPAPLVEVEA
jgi:hypothetical protein